jgi:hypothetical protein
LDREALTALSWELVDAVPLSIYCTQVWPIAVHGVADELASLPVVVVVVVKEPPLKPPIPDNTVQVTVAPTMGLPAASVTFTTIGSKAGRAIVGQPSQISCPFPWTTEIFCADAVLTNIRPMSIGANRIGFIFTKIVS